MHGRAATYLVVAVDGDARVAHVADVAGDSGYVESVVFDQVLPLADDDMMAAG